MRTIGSRAALCALILAVLAACSDPRPADSDIGAEIPTESTEIAETRTPLAETAPEASTAQTEKNGPPKNKAEPDVFGEYSTKIVDAGKNRMKNLKLCVKKLNGAVLEPGDEFSFNRTVGRRTMEKGYRKATVFKDDKRVKEVGGGICQVSTTIYNAALDAGFEILERHEHGLPVEYIEEGMDATVYYGRLDLRFRNTSGRKIKITAEIKNDRVAVKLIRA